MSRINGNGSSNVVYNVNRFIVSGDGLKANIVPDSAKVFRFDIEYSLSPKQVCNQNNIDTLCAYFYIQHSNRYTNTSSHCFLVHLNFVNCFLNAFNFCFFCYFLRENKLA